MKPTTRAELERELAMFLLAWPEQATALIASTGQPVFREPDTRAIQDACRRWVDDLGFVRNVARDRGYTGEKLSDFVAIVLTREINETLREVKCWTESEGRHPWEWNAERVGIGRGQHKGDAFPADQCAEIIITLQQDRSDT